MKGIVALRTYVLSRHLLLRTTSLVTDYADVRCRVDSFHLEGHVVLSAERAGGVRTVLVEPVEREGACPDCGVLSSRIQARPVHRVRDVRCGGEPLEVRVRKRRLACLEPQCPRRSVVQTTDEVPLRSRLTSRLVTGIVADLSTELRAVSRVAAASGVSWTTAMHFMEDTAVLDGCVDRRLVRRLGVDELRFRRVR